MGNLKRLGVQFPADGRDRLAVLTARCIQKREPFTFHGVPQYGMNEGLYPRTTDFSNRTFGWAIVGRCVLLANFSVRLSDKLLAKSWSWTPSSRRSIFRRWISSEQLKLSREKFPHWPHEGRGAKRRCGPGTIWRFCPDLITFSKDAAELLADLNPQQRMFLLTFTVVTSHPPGSGWKTMCSPWAASHKYSCAKRLDWQQEQGAVSSLVLGYNGIEIQRGMTTSSAIFIPFMTGAPHGRAALYMA